jgi:uncharacterized protein
MQVDPIKRLIYLHGFRSSACSVKARELAKELMALNSPNAANWEWITPDLSHDPAAAMAQIESTLIRAPGMLNHTTLIGSSLGGYYAAHFAERFGCKAVLLNPSIAPHETLAAHIGPQTNLYTGESFDFTKAHIDALAAHPIVTITHPEYFLVIVEMGDALLDHKKTLAKYAGAKQIVIEGGDHDLKSFPQHIHALLTFAGVLS